MISKLNIMVSNKYYLIFKIKMILASPLFDFGVDFKIFVVMVLVIKTMILNKL
jgi:hypothetical protein